MKWSMCTTGFKEKMLEETAAIARRMGMDGIEIWLGHLDAVKERDGTLARLSELLGGYGLDVPMISTYACFSKSELERKNSLMETERAMRLAAALQCPAVRIFAGHLPFSQATEEEWKSSMDSLEQAMKLADLHGVNIALEVHNNTFADCIRGVEAIFSEIGHPRLRLIFDGFNLFVDGRDQMKALPRLYRWIDHIHLKNYRWNPQNWENSIPVSALTGDVDNRMLLNELIGRGYQGYISFEYFGEQKERCIRQSMQEVKATLRKK
ncbi:sugar phosphate isomerase/epimerase family protein [Brevibacillus formosus]|uniref:sugar phosphate isomerase/epimerase family protein n=1 Tax=Brevibacillus formosus TaxID=54913 RepID=UPI003F1A648D